MSKRMKYHPHGSVLFCTFSLEEGLLLLSNPLCQAIIKSCLARAQALCPVKICHIVTEATHVHLILVVDNPDDVYGFIRNFKVETAHMFNRLLGRDKRTVWCEGYDSPIVLTPVRALAAIAYMYSNPAKDNLERSIDEYPGFSSWQMFLKGDLVKTWKRLRRFQFHRLRESAHSLKGYTAVAEQLLSESDEVQPFFLEPNAWMEAFGIHDSEQQKRINERIVERTRTLEQRAERLRAKTGKTVLGRVKMLHERLNTTYRPKRSGRRMWCLSEKRSVRVRFITFFKGLMRTARNVRQRWLAGDVTVRYPAGLHPPSMPKLANVVGW
jgi:Transposase IS200 like